jgi:hypothetical protein
MRPTAWHLLAGRAGSEARASLPVWASPGFVGLVGGALCLLDAGGGPAKGRSGCVDEDPLGGAAIRARLVFARDGEQWLYGWAVAWTKDAVCVQLEDRRLPTSRIWLAPSDVQRRLMPTDRQSR